MFTLLSRQRFIPALILVFGMAVSLGVASVLNHALRANDEERLQRYASAAHQAVEERIITYIAMLRSTAGFFTSRPELTHQEFETYVAQLGLHSHYAGVQGIGYSQRIDEQNIEAFEQAQRKGRFEDFSVWPDTPRDEYHSITYLEPLDQRNRTAIGYDMHSEPKRRMAMDQARDTGDVAMTDRLILVQEIHDDVQPGFNIYLPIYSGSNLETVAQRRAALRGFIYSPFRAGDLFENIFTDPLFVDFAVYTSELSEPATLLYATADPATSSSADSGFQRTARLQSGNSNWHITYWPAEQFVYSHTWWIFASVLLLGGLISTGLALLSYKERRARRETELSERHFRNIFETQFQFLTIVSPKGDIVNVNTLLLRLAAADRTSVLGKPIWQAPWWGDDLKDEELWRTRFSEVRTLKRPLNTTDQMCLAGESLRIVESAMTAVADRAGRVEFYLLQAHDITDHHRTERRLKEETQTLEALNRLGRSLSSKLDSNELMGLATKRARALSGASVACFLYRQRSVDDSTDLVTAVSGIPEEIFEAEYRSLGSHLFHLTLKERRTILVRDLFDQEAPVIPLPPMLSPDGDFAFRSLLAVPVISRNDDVIGALVLGNSEPAAFSEREVQIMEGITAQTAIGIDNARLYETLTQSEEKFRQLAEAAEAANQAKSEFLANMSHEIRTPVNVITGLTAVMSEDTTADQRARFLATMQASSRQLLELINDLLDLSKIEAGSLELERQPFMFGELLRDVGLIYGEAARQKGLELERDIADAQVLPALLGDPLRLKQVLINLLDNAIKFTAAGKVAIRIRKQHETAETVQLLITVEDTGVGISPEARPLIFGMFNQADSSITRRFGGTGLGLAITRNLIEQMNGSITVESDEGAGSKFIIDLTLAKIQSQVMVASSAKDAIARLPDVSSTKEEHCQLLVVEDYEPNRLVLDSMLKLLGYKSIHFAETGTEALAMFDETQFDLILMDIQMPGMDGLSVTREMRDREMEAARQAAVIIGVTAHALADDRQRCLDAGMNSYLAKPYTIESLKALLQHYLHGRACI